MLKGVFKGGTTMALSVFFFQTIYEKKNRSWQATNSQ